MVSFLLLLPLATPAAVVISARLQRNACSGVSAMKPELQQIFDNTSEDDPRSKLEPYRELILRWRRQGKSYRKLTKLLADHFGLKVGTMTVHEFVQRRSRPRKSQPESEALSAPELITPIITYSPAAPMQPELPSAESPSFASTDRYAADRERMRRHKVEPIAPQLQKRFSYTEEDSLKPL
jgi:hypothetical protein